MAWLFNLILGQIAWAIIHFELRTLWNPDWTYAMPYTTGGNDYYLADYGAQDVAFYDQNSNYPYGEDPLEVFSMKDGLPIPLLQMTYINKTTPKPCDKEVTLYELNEGMLYRSGKMGRRPMPVKGKLRCHDTECERYSENFNCVIFMKLIC